MNGFAWLILVCLVLQVNVAWAGTTKIVFGGDSITAGSAGDPAAYSTFVERSQANLPTEYPGSTWTFWNEGVNGTTTADWSGWVSSKITSHTPNIVVLMLGTNDATQTGYSPHVDLAVYQSNLVNIVTSIRAYNNGSAYNGGKPYVILMTPPPLYEARATSNRYNSLTTQYADAVRSVVSSFNSPGVLLADPWSGIYPHLGDGDIGSYYFATDGIHLIDPGHAIIYTLLHTQLASILSVDGTVVAETGNGSITISGAALSPAGGSMASLGTGKASVSGQSLVLAMASMTSVATSVGVSITDLSGAPATITTIDGSPVNLSGL